MKRHGRPNAIVTDRLRSYRSAMKEIGKEARQLTGGWLNNRAENSHQPFRRRERAMLKFRSTKSLQKFVSIQSAIYNHFNQNRHLYSRVNFKDMRAAALAVSSHQVVHSGRTVETGVTKLQHSTESPNEHPQECPSHTELVPKSETGSV